MVDSQIWEPIPGYEGIYSVSNFGLIKSLPKRLPRGSGFYLRGEKILKQYLNEHGYLTVVLYRECNANTLLVHRLVAATFLGDSSLPVDHMNAIKTDNRPKNLRFCSQRENVHAHFRQKKKTSIYVGVNWNIRAGKWASKIYLNNKRVFLGYFNDEHEAYLAYETARINANAS